MDYYFIFYSYSLFTCYRTKEVTIRASEQCKMYSEQNFGNGYETELDTTDYFTM